LFRIILNNIKLLYLAKHSDTMATCTYTIDNFAVLIGDPTSVSVNFFSNVEGQSTVVVIDISTGGGITSAKAQFSSVITNGGGTVVTNDITWDGGTFTGTFNLVYTYPDNNITVGNLMGIGIDSNYIGATVVCDETPCPPVIITQCDTCLELTVPACQDVYTITAGLTADTDYVVVLTDHFSNQYIIDVTSDADGDLAIDMTSSEIPQGFTTPEFSPVQIEVRLTDDGTDEAITVNSVEYPCVKLNFVYRTDATPIVTWFLMTDFGEPITDDGGVNIDAD